MSTTSTTTAKPAFQSLTLRSIAAIAVAAVASRFGFALPEGVPQQLAGAVIDLVMTLGVVGAAVGRVRARAPIA